ncbi:MAG: UPF0182 family protein [Candidatus Helarchaeota archaeon]|nr:UPF0182 family protein [Candidatus Helarchaeota archaeon]
MNTVSISDRKKKLLKIIIGVSVAGVILFIVLVSVILNLVINQQFYENRLGLNWWTYLTMDNAAILWCPLVAIGVLAGVVTALIPTSSSTLNLIYKMMRRNRPSRMKCLIWNYAVVAGVGGLAAGWTIGFFFDAGFGIFVANYANISYSFFPTLFAALGYPLNPGTMDINVLFAYTYILRPFILLAIGAIMVKIALDLINAFAFRGERGANPLKTAGMIAFIISLAFFIWWLFLPNGAYDVVKAAVVLPIIICFFASLVIGSIFYIAGVINPSRYRGERYYKPLIALAIIALIILPASFFIVAGVKSLYREANWNQWTWDTKLSTQIETTRTAAGLNNFTKLTTQQLLDNQSTWGTKDEDIIPHIRTFDYQASRLKMVNKIGTNWEELADSDIHYIDGSEYWIAPRTIRSSGALDLDWVQDHLIYTHSRGFVALNPVTGDHIPLSSYETTFGVPYNSSIYFGELPDNGYTILNETRYHEIEKITYQGAPDISLKGFLNWWYIDEWGFKTGNETHYLIKRNINDRIGGILLPHMVIGDDPYLVFDKNNSKMYYCVDIILDIPSFSRYMEADIVRWLGVVLVDTALGTMNFYLYNNSYADLPYDFLQIYIDMYNWEEMPDWLVPQLKYPEILIEYQLEIDYTYHVTDSDTWRSGEDFFERPSATDYHHIIYDVGYGPTYVGASIVEFSEATIGNLVGFYIVENGGNSSFLGRVTFYRNGTLGQTEMIGLNVATSAYSQKDANFLELLSVPRFGNFLIYPLANSLYYVIPVYETTGEGIETLMRVALVNAFDPGTMGIGNNITHAYNSLNVTTEVPPGVLSLNVVSAPAFITEGEYEDLEILINNGYTTQSFNVSLEISTGYALFNVSFAGQEITPEVGGGFYNYSIANLTLLETQYTGLIPQISGLITGGQPFSPVNYVVNLFNETGHLIDSKPRTAYIYP